MKKSHASGFANPQGDGPGLPLRELKKPTPDQQPADQQPATSRPATCRPADLQDSRPATSKAALETLHWCPAGTVADPIHICICFSYVCHLTIHHNGFHNNGGAAEGGPPIVVEAAEGRLHYGCFLC